MELLICDSGSTKAQWIYRQDDKILLRKTQGLNPYRFDDVDHLAGCIAAELAAFRHFSGRLIFYGAGCAAAHMRLMMHQALQRVFADASVEVYDDLLGAARATARNKPAIVLVLGTGMNNGFYDGSSFRFQVDSLGYVLGDEGSGTDLGRRLLRAALRRTLPEPLATVYAQFNPLDRNAILDKVYRSRDVRQFLASQVMFLASHQQHPWVMQFLAEAFDDLMRNVMVHYAPMAEHNVHVTGGVGYQFRKVIGEHLKKYGFKTGVFKHDLAEGLLHYHSVAEPSK